MFLVLLRFPVLANWKTLCSYYYRILKFPFIIYSKIKNNVFTALALKEISFISLAQGNPCALLGSTLLPSFSGAVDCHLAILFFTFCSALTGDGGSLATLQLNMSDFVWLPIGGLTLYGEYGSGLGESGG